ncbi:MAG: 3-hydroxyacyl-CoA dehydrogenase [Planctomycetaceae bacterium]|nr:3-hydroxyacyl-CoA dehydrogenase [Planctomycetaceae bacterium]
MQIEGRVAVVAGGASGLGEATVRRLVERGAKVTVLDRDEVRGEALSNQLGDKVAFSAGDVTNEEQVAAAVDRAVDAFDRIEIVVNCAGIGVSARTVRRDSPHDLSDFRRVVSVNVFGTFSVLSQAAFKMADNQPDEHGCRGVIVNTSSIAAFDGQIGQAAYAASKGGIVGMTLPIARDLASLGIRCCTICPGTFDTPLLGQLPEARKRALAEAIPHPRRLGDPLEYALLVEQIITNPYLNGETIRLDGALRMSPK